jgi:hypothetical protein
VFPAKFHFAPAFASPAPAERLTLLNPVNPSKPPAKIPYIPLIPSKFSCLFVSCSLNRLYSRGTIFLFCNRLDYKSVISPSGQKQREQIRF